MTVVPIASENGLRTRAWVEHNRRLVDKLSGGQLAYVYVPNTAGAGHTYFKRYFYPQAHKAAIIIDERYNGGGYLDLASEVAYMIANTTLTSGRTFERIVFNDKNPSRNPITGEILAPTPFHSTTQGFAGAGTANQPLPWSQDDLHQRGVRAQHGGRRRPLGGAAGRVREQVHERLVGVGLLVRGAG